MFYCIYEVEYVYSGKTLKEAYDNCVDQNGGCRVDDVTFVEGQEVQVEFQVVKKEVVNKITKTK